MNLKRVGKALAYPLKRFPQLFEQRYTDPSWTPLFVLASAVISDTGGPLSHSAIVAREYNIPAVLGIGNATDVLEDGDEVFVYSHTGKVILLTKKI